MSKFDSQTVQLVIVAAVAVTMLLQAVALLAIFNLVRKATESMRKDIDEFKTSVVPVIDNVRELLVHTAPKIETAATDIAAMSHNLRRQTADIQVAANGIVERIQSQSARLDAMLTNVFDGVDRASGFMSSTVTKPMRSWRDYWPRPKLWLNPCAAMHPRPRLLAIRLGAIKTCLCSRRRLQNLAET